MSRIYIGNLSPDCRERDVEELFKCYGKISNIELHGVYGFLNFHNKKDASDAIREVNGSYMHGERLRVAHAHPLPRKVEERRRDRERKGNNSRDQWKKSSSGGDRRRSGSRSRSYSVEQRRKSSSRSAERKSRPSRSCSRDRRE